MKITDVAKTMAPDLPLRNVGIRPGEKLHEVMISEDDSALQWSWKTDMLFFQPTASGCLMTISKRVMNWCPRDFTIKRYQYRLVG